jgi:hypothetical protein
VRKKKMKEKIMPIFLKSFERLLFLSLFIFIVDTIMIIMIFRYFNIINWMYIPLGINLFFFYFFVTKYEYMFKKKEKTMFYDNLDNKKQNNGIIKIIKNKISSFKERK